MGDCRAERIPDNLAVNLNDFDSRLWVNLSSRLVTWILRNAELQRDEV